jgi:hypothetical protein
MMATAPLAQLPGGLFDMWPLIGVVSVFAGFGVACAGIVFDFRGWRTRWIEIGDPDDHLRSSRRLGILGFGWLGMLIGLYAVLGFVIDLLIGR